MKQYPVTRNAGGHRFSEPLFLGAAAEKSAATRFWRVGREDVVTPPGDRLGLLKLLTMHDDLKVT